MATRAQPYSTAFSLLHGLQGALLFIFALPHLLNTFDILYIIRQCRVAWGETPRRDREHFGDASRLKALLRESHAGTEIGTASADDDTTSTTLLGRASLAAPGVQRHLRSSTAT